jgi:hypothetical protein
MNFQEKALKIVRDHVAELGDKSDPPLEFDVYIVWFCKTLQNWKALISTTLPDQMYYEVTYDGDRYVTYLDVYKKFRNIAVQDDQLPLI